MMNAIAEKLWQARTNGTRIDCSSLELPKDERSAIMLQNELTKASGAKVVGFKIGATSQGALDLLGLEEPFVGPLFNSYCRNNGDTVPAFDEHNALLESEIVVGIGEDMPARNTAYSSQEVRDASAWVSPGFELCAIRFDVALAGNGLLLISDSGINMDFVLGDKSTDFRDLDLAEHHVALSINGKEVASGHSGMSLLGDPFDAVAWLAGHAAIRDRGLKAGDIVTTGTCTGMTPVAAGDEATADFGSMGKVTTRLVPA
jgi:2-keto-4-pentenoate hydratase